MFRYNHKFKNYRESRAGFTLIELLVVISIIGLLASVVLVALNGARGKARFTRMMADFKQLSTAAELLYDKEGFYPCDVPPSTDPGTGGATAEENTYCIRKGFVQSGIISKFPTPPCSGWEYDWENWSSLVALPTGNAQSHIVRISLRGGSGAFSDKYHFCIKDTHGSAEYQCGGRTGDGSYTLGGIMANGLTGGSLSCN